MISADNRSEKMNTWRMKQSFNNSKKLFNRTKKPSFSAGREVLSVADVPQLTQRTMLSIPNDHMVNHVDLH